MIEKVFTLLKQVHDRLCNCWWKRLICIVNKLPYKFRERWRTTACDMQKKKAQRSNFKDFVEFINMHTKVAPPTFFGDIKDSNKGQAKISGTPHVGEEEW